MKIARLGALALALAAVIAVIAVASPAEAVVPGNFRTVAHRGYHHHHTTENTVRALVLAKRHGATAMEADLRLTRDRRMLVMHDVGLRRTTTCRGRVDAHRGSRIVRHCRTNDGQRIPFASTLVRAARHHHLNLMLEIKSDRRHRWTRHQFVRLAHVVNHHHMRKRVVLMSFKKGLLRRAEHARSWLPTVWIAPRTSTVRQVDRVVHRVADRVSLNRRTLRAGVVHALNARGHEVYGRRANTRAAWRAYAHAGVSGTVTDRIRAYTRWARARRI